MKRLASLILLPDLDSNAMGRQGINTAFSFMLLKVFLLLDEEVGDFLFGNHGNHLYKDPVRVFKVKIPALEISLVQSKRRSCSKL